MLIPNKTIDNIITDTLKSISKYHSNAFALRQVTSESSNSNNNLNHNQICTKTDVSLSESQDIDMWTERYNNNQVTASKTSSNLNSSSSNTFSTPNNYTTNGPLGRIMSSSVSTHRPPLPPPPPPAYIAMMSGYNIEDVLSVFDEYDCTDSLVERARSGRSRCIQCRILIPMSELRVGVYQEHEQYASQRKWLHLGCISMFNSTRVGRSSVRYSSLHGLDALSDGELAQVTSAISN